MLSSLRRLLTRLIAIIEDRLELISDEWVAEVHRLLRALVWTLVALLFLALALLMGALTFVIAMWEQDRLLASLWVTGGFLLIAAIAIWQVWRALYRSPRLFASTLEALRKDRESLSRRNTLR